MPTVAIHPGEIIFVTGVNGLIGSHIADQLLKRGYNVRGAVRDVEKSKWLKDYFDGKYKDTNFDLAAVADISVEGCYDEAVKGVSGFVHVASPLMGESPDIIIPKAINAGLNALKAAAKNPSIKRVVYTSSSVAVTFPMHNGEEKIIDQNTYNEVGIAQGWNPPADGSEVVKGLLTYAALKTESERACWKWINENKPSFVFNTICPNINQSKVLVPEYQGTPSTIGWSKAVFTGGPELNILSKVLGPQWFISTEDCALLHISALIHSEVKNERIFGFAEHWSINKVLAIYRKAYPDRTFPEDIPGEVTDSTKVPRERPEEILKWVKNGEGWDSLEKSVKEMASQFV